MGTQKQKQDSSYKVKTKNMEKRLLHLFLALVCMVTQAAAMDGSGTAADPYLISSAAELIDFYKISVTNPSACAKLTADIDLSSVCSATVGNWKYDIGSYTTPFARNFDGAGHTVSILYVKYVSGNYDPTAGNALFGFVSGTVKNVKVKDSYIYEDSYTGGLAAIGLCNTVKEGGLIENCSVEGGTYTTFNAIGGMVINNYGTVRGCTNADNFDCGGEGILGGIVAENDATGVVSLCVNNGNLKFENTGQQAFGGIVGYNLGIVENCINNGFLTYNESGQYSGSPVGGIVGDNASVVRNCMNTGSLQGNYPANLCMIVRYCYDTGTVTNCYYRDDAKLYKNGVVQSMALKGYEYNYNTSSTPETTPLTSAQCASGEAAWRLNGSVATTDVWKQLLGTDANPSPLSSYTVYYAPSPYSNYNTDAGGTYLIYNAGDLKLFADKVNASTANAGLNAKLMADIDLSPICGANVGNWTPIANDAAGYSDNSDKQYSGTFDGNGKIISGLYINASSDHNALFCYVGPSSVVKNFTVNATINGIKYCSAIAAYSIGTISGCTAKGTITSEGYSGGIVSDNRGMIERCANEAKVTSSVDAYIGGIVGRKNNGTVNYCMNSGIIENTGSCGTETGGIVGYNNNGAISNSYNMAAVTGNGYVGGIVGLLMEGSVADCYNTANVTSTGAASLPSGHKHPSSTGAIVGYEYDEIPITNCHYLSTITLKKDNNAMTTLVGVGSGGKYEANTYAQTLADFHSGKIARLLNGGDGTTESATSVWGQNLATTGGDAYPVMMADGNANAVYCASVNDVKTYCNTGKVITIPAATTAYVDEKIYSGDYKDASSTVVSGSRTIENADITLSQSVDNMASHKSTADSYYEISIAVQMKWFEYYVNATTDHAATNARLMADIDLSSVCSATVGNWTPIANYAAGYQDYWPPKKLYTGTFDGNNKTISGLYIHGDKSHYNALFYYNGGTIKNLTVDADIDAVDFDAAIAYDNYGTIGQCTSKGKSKGSTQVGGLVTINNGVIEYCTNEAAIISTLSARLGGIAEFNNP